MKSRIKWLLLFVVIWVVAETVYMFVTPWEKSTPVLIFTLVCISLASVGIVIAQKREARHE